MKAVILLAALLVAGCATTPSAPIEVGTAPTCNTDADCTAKWAGARTYVLAHAGMRMQTYSADFMQTYNAPQHDMTVAAEVNKAPAPGGGYILVAKFWCGNPFGCMENPRALLAGFNREVSGGGTP